MSRQVSLQRKTNETEIDLKLELDGQGQITGSNPIPFFDHMLTHLCKYSLFNIELQLKGDIEIDCHHSVEDTGIVLGQALKQAIGNKKGINRYGSFTLPMDDVLVTVAVDLSGRSFFKASGVGLAGMGKFGIYDSELSLEFLYKFAEHAAMNLHVLIHYGDNRHHIHEAVFKALGFALRQAVSLDEKRKNEIPSTKGSL